MSFFRRNRPSNSADSLLKAVRRVELSVLVVDDSSSDAFMARKALERYGIKDIVLADHPQIALQKLESRPFDVVLIDYMLPRMNGLQLLERIKQEHPQTTVIMMTGLRDDRVAADSIKLGASEYVSKDEFLTSALMHAIQACLREKDERAEQHLKPSVDDLEDFDAEMRWQLDHYADGLSVRIRPSNPAAGAGLPAIRDACEQYIAASLEAFPELALREEDAFINLLMEHGSSPNELLNVFSNCMHGLDIDVDTEIPLKPMLLVHRLLIRLLIEYQIQATLGSMIIQDETAA